MNCKSEPKTYFQNKHSARFFAEQFLLVFGKNALDKCPNMDGQIIPKLKAELKRMQESFFKIKKKTLKPLAKTIKCSSLRCRSGGNLDTKNTDKYAQCVICEGCEHFKVGST